MTKTMCWRLNLGAAVPVLLAINMYVARTSGLREGRAYLGCREQLVIAEDTVYEEEMKCHNVTRSMCMTHYETVFEPKEGRMGHLPIRSLKVEKCRDRFRMRCEIRYVEVPQTFKVEKCVDGGRLCFNTSKTVVHDVPEEDCTFTPQKECYLGVELLPTLQALETCVSIPEEVCSTVRTNPKTVRKPIIRKTCPEEELKESIQDCGDLLRSKHNLLMDGIAGIHEFQFDGAPNSTQVECDKDGWTVIQSRGQFGNRNAYFYRRWNSYVDGFGVPGAEYWMGLDNMFFLARQKNYELRVTLTDANGEKGVGIWHSFILDNRDTYNLLVGDYHGGLGEVDSLAYHNGRPFSTPDKDNDEWVGNCAKRFKGAWWYGACHYSNLNGMNLNQNLTETYANGIVWDSFRGYYHSLSEAQFALREVGFHKP